MSESKKYAIYVTEQPMESTYDEEHKQWHHTSLWLVEEENGEAAVMQQLHFNNYSEDFWEEELGTSTMVPNVRFGLCKSQNPEEMLMTAVKRGTEQEMLACWNHMLQFSVDLRAQRIGFDLQDSHLPHANNCRAGVIAALKTIGVQFDPRLYADEGGTLAERIRPGRVLTAMEIGRQGQLSKMREENKILTEALPMPWDSDKLMNTSALGRVLGARFDITS